MNRDRALEDCPFCSETQPGSDQAGLREIVCAGCARWLVVCSDRACYPMTGMGGQTAAYHERSLREPLPNRRLPLRYRPLLRRELSGGRELTISPSAIVVSQCDIYADGMRSTWYPLHISWLRGWRRSDRQRELAARYGEPVKTVRPSALYPKSNGGESQ